MRKRMIRAVAPVVCGVFGMMGAGAAAEEPLVSAPFVILVKDAETGRPVPMVELRTVHGVQYFTDNAGVVAFDEPGFAGRKVYFHVAGPGYSVAEDGFGLRGSRLEVGPGKEAEIEVKREQLAERMFRITGAGRFHHSVRAGLPTPAWAEELNANAIGQDSAHTVEMGGKLYWFWGDTNRLEYPLGIFHMAAATSPLPAPDPAEGGISLTYFRDEKGDAREVAKMPGEGPSWLSGFTVLKDEGGKEHLVATYVKVRGFIDVYRRGLSEWDADEEMFRPVHTFPDDTLKSDLFPHGHPVRHRVGDKEYVYYGTGFPKMRIPAEYGAWKDAGKYQAVESDVALTDVKTGEAVEPHYATVAWNPFRECYVALFARAPKAMGALSETWYTEAPAPEGPWRKAVLVATHGAHSFYNPLQHPQFAQEGGRILYFEGTYTTLFTDRAVPTPRYDYNQILYRLDLGKVAEEMGKE